MENSASHRICLPRAVSQRLTAFIAAEIGMQSLDMIGEASAKEFVNIETEVYILNEHTHHKQ